MQLCCGVRKGMQRHLEKFSLSRSEVTISMLLKQVHFKNEKHQTDLLIYIAEHKVLLLEGPLDSRLVDLISCFPNHITYAHRCTIGICVLFVKHVQYNGIR